MSLNQIIDHDPTGNLVVDPTLILKAESIRLQNGISFAPAGTSYRSPAYVVTLFSSGSERLTVGTGRIGQLHLFKVGKQVTLRVPKFTINSAAVDGTGVFYVNITPALPADWLPIDGAVSAVQCQSNAATLTTACALSYESNILLKLSADFTNLDFTTGITGTSTLAAGPITDMYMTWFTA